MGVPLAAAVQVQGNPLTLNDRATLVPKTLGHEWITIYKYAALVQFNWQLKGFRHRPVQRTV
jgi:hypothetical protein